MIVERHSGQGWRMLDMSLVEPASNASGIGWRTDLSLLVESEETSVDVSLAIESTSFVVAPLHAEVWPQRVISDLLGLEGATVAGLPVSAGSLPFGAEEADGLVEVLLAPGRRLPVIVLAPRPSGERCLVAADDLARRLVGIALVAEITDPKATFLLSDRLGLRLSCYDGAARIYWPGLAQQRDPYAHPLFLRSHLEALGEQAAMRDIAETVREVAVLRHSYSRKHEARRQEAAAAALAQRDTEQDLNDILEENLLRGNKIKYLQQQLSKKDEEIKELRYSLATARQKLATRPSPPPDPSAAKSVYDAMIAAKEAGHPRLRFTEDCVRSAASSPFKNVRKVADLLAAAQEVAQTMFTAGGDPRKLFNERGFEFKPHISVTQRGKYKSDYTYTINGRRQIVEPHITVGRGSPAECLSAYFAIDKENGLFWFVRLGEHPKVDKS